MIFLYHVDERHLSLTFDHIGMLRKFKPVTVGQVAGRLYHMFSEFHLPQDEMLHNRFIAELLDYDSVRRDILEGGTEDWRTFSAGEKTLGLKQIGTAKNHYSETLNPLVLAVACDDQELAVALTVWYRDEHEIYERPAGHGHDLTSNYLVLDRNSKRLRERFDSTLSVLDPVNFSPNRITSNDASFISELAILRPYLSGAPANAGEVAQEAVTGFYPENRWVRLRNKRLTVHHAKLIMPDGVLYSAESFPIGHPVDVVHTIYPEFLRNGINYSIVVQRSGTDVTKTEPGFDAVYEDDLSTILGLGEKKLAIGDAEYTRAVDLRSRYKTPDIYLALRALVGK